MNENHVAIIVRTKYPQLGKKCDYESGRSAAIRLMCLHCMGGESDASKSVKNCQSKECPLWRYRLGSGSQPTPVNEVPSKEFYDKKIANSVSAEKRARGRVLGLQKNQ